MSNPFYKGTKDKTELCSDNLNKLTIINGGRIANSNIQLRDINVRINIQDEDVESE